MNIKHPFSAFFLDEIARELIKVRRNLKKPE
jgi:hypothetical protein